MKFSLTITDASAADITRLMALLNGSAANVATAPSSPAIPPMPQTTDDDGGEDGPANPNAPAVDSSGLPWDERIHSSNRAMTDKGVWRKRRGVPDATVAQVEAELRARAAPQQPAPMFDQSVPTPAQQPVAPAPMPVMQMPQPMPQMPAPMPQQPAPMQSAPAPMPQMPAPAPMPQQPQPNGVSMDFPTFMQALSQQMQKRDANGMPLIDTDYLARVTTEIATAFGAPLGVITDIVSQPRASEMIIYAVQAMTRDGKWN